MKVNFAAVGGAAGGEELLERLIKNAQIKLNYSPPLQRSSKETNRG